MLCRVLSSSLLMTRLAFAMKVGEPLDTPGPAGVLGTCATATRKIAMIVLDAHLGATAGEVAQMRLHDRVPHLEQVADVGRREPPVAHDLGADVRLEEARETRLQLRPLLLRRAGDVVGAERDGDEFRVGLAHRRVARFERGIQARGLFLLKRIESEQACAFVHGEIA